MTQLASSSLDHSVMIWNFKPQLRAFRFVGHKAPVTSVDFSPNGQLLASSSRDKTIRLWTPNVKGDVTVFKAHTSTVRNVQFSKDGESLVTCSDDKTIKIWSTPRTRFQYTLSGHMNWVRTCKFSPDSRVVVSGSDDKTVKLWDLSSKSCVKTYWDHTGMVTSVAFHPSGTIVASASTDRSIKLFDIRTHKLIQHYSDAHGSPSTPHINGEAGIGGVNSISFGGKAGEWLISTGMDGVVKIWDLKEGHLFYTLYGHKHGPTTSAVFSNDGSYFATGGSDSQVMVWKANFDELIESQETPDSTNGRALHSSSGYSHISHPIHTELSSAGAGKSQPSVVLQPPTKNGPSGLKTNRKVNTAPSDGLVGGRDDQPIIVDVGGPLFTDQDLGEETADAIQSGNKIGSKGSEIKKQPLEVRTIPDQLTSSLQHIVRQMDILTQTMSILENRLTMNENRVIEMSQKFDEGMKRLESNFKRKDTPDAQYVEHSFGGMPIPKAPARETKIPDMSGLVLTETVDADDEELLLGS